LHEQILQLAQNVRQTNRIKSAASHWWQTAVVIKKPQQNKMLWDGI